jgi:hypothetical protein
MLFKLIHLELHLLVQRVLEDINAKREFPVSNAVFRQPQNVKTHGTIPVICVTANVDDDRININGFYRRLSNFAVAIARMTPHWKRTEKQGELL